MRSNNTSRDATRSVAAHIDPVHMLRTDRERLPTCGYVYVTPKMASDWLSFNNGNRKYRDWWVRSIANAIRRDEWIPTHQGIAFARSGRLLDGQHRLMAIVLSGIAVPMLVVKDVDDEAFKVVDCGQKRSYSDLTGLSKKTAEVCRHFWMLLFHSGAATPTASQILSIAEAGVGELSDDLLATCPTSQRVLSSVGFRAAAVLLALDGTPKEYVFNAYRTLVLRHEDEMTPLMKVIRRKVEDGSLDALGFDATHECFAHGWVCFNPLNHDKKSMLVNRMKLEDLIKEIRDVAREKMRWILQASMPD